MKTAHTQIVDQVVEVDDELMELYLEQGEELEPEQLHDPFEQALRDAGIEAVELKRQLAPPWTTDWLTEEGKAKLEAYGIAPPSTPKGPERCPHCGGTDLERISQFGSTPCKAQWRCTSCLEPFDYFKCI